MTQIFKLGWSVCHMIFPPQTRLFSFRSVRIQYSLRNMSEPKKYCLEHTIMVQTTDKVIKHNLIIIIIELLKHLNLKGNGKNILLWREFQSL